MPEKMPMYFYICSYKQISERELHRSLWQQLNTLDDDNIVIHVIFLRQRAAKECNYCISSLTSSGANNIEAGWMNTFFLSPFQLTSRMGFAYYFFIT